MKRTLRDVIFAAIACGLLGLTSPASAQFRDVEVDENLNCVRIAEICGFNLAVELLFEEPVVEVESTGGEHSINTGPISEEFFKFGEFLGIYTGEIAIRRTEGGEVVDYFDQTSPVPNQQLDVGFIEPPVVSEGYNAPSGEIAGLDAIFIKAGRTFFLRCGVNMTPDLLTGLRPAVPGHKRRPPQISHVSACYGQGSCMSPQSVVDDVCAALNPNLNGNGEEGASTFGGEEPPDPMDPNFIAQIFNAQTIDDTTINSCGCPPFNAIFCEPGSALCTQVERPDILSQGAISTLLTEGSPGCRTECLLSLCASRSGGSLITDDCNRSEKRFCRSFCD